ILVSSNQIPYDWWTGFQEHLFTPHPPRTADDWRSGVIRPYAQRRMLSFLDWVAAKFPVDVHRIYTAGVSMGGSRSIMPAVRNPDRFAWVMSWVGIHRPLESPTYKSSYTEVYGPPEYGVKYEDGTPVWNYFDDVSYLKQHPDVETPLIVFANGKNDVNIGW